MRASRTSTFLFIRDAWRFYRKQPVLHAVLLWLWIVPVAIANLVSAAIPVPDMASQIALDSVLSLLLAVALTWGAAAALLVARRMIQNKAGRARTSFAVVAQQSAPLVFPLLLTSILRFCFTVQRMLLFVLPLAVVLLLPGLCGDTLPGMLTDGAVHDPAAMALAVLMQCPWLPLLLVLLIPAIVYQIRTTFFGIALVAEGRMYRSGLRRSIEVMRGRFWGVILRLAGLCVIVLLPPAILTWLIDEVAALLGPRATGAAIVLESAISSSAGLLVLLSLVALYGSLRADRPERIVPQDADD